MNYRKKVAQRKEDPYIMQYSHRGCTISLRPFEHTLYVEQDINFDVSYIVKEDEFGLVFYRLDCNWDSQLD